MGKIERISQYAKLRFTTTGSWTDGEGFGCAGLGGILDRPLDTPSLGLLLFGEVCTVDDHAEFGNLMLSKLRIIEK